MKKLIISEIISVIIVLGMFLLVFSLMNGWEKTGQERYAAVDDAAAVAAVAAVVFAVAVVAVVAVIIDVAAAVVAVIAAVFAVAVVAVAVVGGNAVGVVIAIAAVVAAVVIVAELEAISKKVVYLSLGVEAVSIIIPILLIAFL